MLRLCCTPRVGFCRQRLSTTRLEGIVAIFVESFLSKRRAPALCRLLPFVFWCGCLSISILPFSFLHCTDIVVAVKRKETKCEERRLSQQSAMTAEPPRRAVVSALRCLAAARPTWANNLPACKDIRADIKQEWGNFFGISQLKYE